MNPYVLNRGPGSRTRPLPTVFPNDYCPQCARGYLHMIELHDHRVGSVMVITFDGRMHCTVCHGRGMDLERIGFGD